MPARKEPQATKYRKNGVDYIRVRWRGHEYFCGPWDEPGSWKRFEELKEDLLSSSTGALTVGDLVADYWRRHAKPYYRHADGSPTSEARSIQANLDRLLSRHKSTPAAEFTPLVLKAYRQHLVGLGSLCRKSINQELGRLVRMFKWAAEEEIVPAAVWHALAAVGGLKKGRCAVVDHPKVTSVPWDDVEATLPFLWRGLQLAVWIQRLSAARPDEALRVRPCDVDRSGPVWIYSPTCPLTGKPRHKTAHLEKSRLIPIGPKLQALLGPWLDATPAEEYCISPAKAVEERLLARNAGRRAGFPSQAGLWRKAEPLKRPGARYTVDSYAHAIVDAVAKANLARACQNCQAKGDPPPCERCADPARKSGYKGPYHQRCKQCRDRARLWCAECRARVVPEWHPNQLRHAALDAIAERVGILSAQRVAGHSDPSTTQIYLDEHLEQITKIAIEMG